MKSSRDEKRFLERVRHHPDRVVLPDEHSVMEGFEYFGTAEYQELRRQRGEKPRHALIANGLLGFLKLILGFARNIRGVFGGIRRGFRDVDGYVALLEEGGALPESPQALQDGFPNEALWSALKTYAWEKHRVVVGFTALPSGYVFTDKAVLFRHALVLVKEMRKEPIERAPQVDAGVEVVTVYNALGRATNDIARWLRDEGVVCMANHPLGGLVDTTPLAENAGLGAIGHSGLLITPEFGPRCRIAPIFVDHPLFAYTDSDEHDWIHGYCDSCHRCERACPQGAILPEKRVSVRYGGGLRDRTETIDREKCYLYFRQTMGCSLCISSCPFSKNPDGYDRRKARFRRSA